MDCENDKQNQTAYIQLDDMQLELLSIFNRYNNKKKEAILEFLDLFSRRK